MEIYIQIAGVLFISLSLLHFIFPKYFNWRDELQKLSLINRQIMYVHSFFIAFMVFLMGVLCLTSANELVVTPLGKKISLGLGIFWFIRLGVQLFVYSSQNWKGKSFETLIHILLSLMWTYFSFVFVSNYFS